jgi:hypothetical protein
VHVFLQTFGEGKGTGYTMCVGRWPCAGYWEHRDSYPVDAEGSLTGGKNPSVTSSDVDVNNALYLRIVRQIRFPSICGFLTRICVPISEDSKTDTKITRLITYYSAGHTSMGGGRRRKL